MTMKIRIPSSITQAELLNAMTPLFERLGVSPGEVVGDILILATPAADHPHEIRFEVVVSPESSSAEHFPDALRDGGHPQGDEYAVLTHRINVAVV